MSRTALITGPSRGIGRVCALRLSEAGHRVILAGLELDKLEELAAEIKAAGREAYAIEMDISAQSSIEETFAKAAKEFGRINILVNNAGITRDGLAMRMKREDWDLVLQINLTGTFLAIQQVLPGMMKDRWGRIVNIASVVGQAGNPGQANYVSSKAAVIGLTKAVAQEIASRNITVNAVAPGFIETAMTASLPQEVKDGMMARIPLKRFGSSDDIAAAVRFLASEEAGYITGHVLNVNGGMYM